MTKDGIMYKGKKVDILDCIGANVEACQRSEPNDIQAIVIDGPVLVHLVRPEQSVTFHDYIHRDIFPYIQSHLGKTHMKRVDLIWDLYEKDSLKQETRKERGIGTRLSVHANTKLPNNWSGFLRCDENKSELFSLIAQEICNMTVPEGKEVISTSHKSILCNPERFDMAYLKSRQVAADTCLFLHVADSVFRGMEKAMVRTVDSDVVILALYIFQHYTS